MLRGIATVGTIGSIGMISGKSEAGETCGDCEYPISYNASYENQDDVGFECTIDLGVGIDNYQTYYNNYTSDEQSINDWGEVFPGEWVYKFKIDGTSGYTSTPEDQVSIKEQYLAIYEKEGLNQTMALDVTNSPEQMGADPKPSSPDSEDSSIDFGDVASTVADTAFTAIDAGVRGQMTYSGGAMIASQIYASYQEFIDEQNAMPPHEEGVPVKWEYDFGDRPDEATHYKSFAVRVPAWDGSGSQPDPYFTFQDRLYTTATGSYPNPELETDIYTPRKAPPSEMSTEDKKELDGEHVNPNPSPDSERGKVKTFELSKSPAEVKSAKVYKRESRREGNSRKLVENKHEN